VWNGFRRPEAASRITVIASDSEAIQLSRDWMA